MEESAPHVTQTYHFTIITTMYQMVRSTLRVQPPQTTWSPFFSRITREAIKSCLLPRFLKLEVLQPTCVCVKSRVNVCVLLYAACREASASRARLLGFPKRKPPNSPTVQIARVIPAHVAFSDRFKNQVFVTFNERRLTPGAGTICRADARCCNSCWGRRWKEVLFCWSGIYF